jgi:hypothetical protein
VKPQDYEIAIRPFTEAEGGGFGATVAVLPGCMSDGDTPHEVLENVYAISCLDRSLRGNGSARSGAEARRGLAWPTARCGQRERTDVTAKRYSIHLSATLQPCRPGLNIYCHRFPRANLEAFELEPGMDIPGWPSENIEEWPRSSSRSYDITVLLPVRPHNCRIYC